MGKSLSKHQLLSQCRSKKKYYSEETVKEVVKVVAEKRGTELRSYFCEICRHYHLTKKKKE